MKRGHGQSLGFTAALSAVVLATALLLSARSGQRSMTGSIVRSEDRIAITVSHTLPINLRITQSADTEKGILEFTVEGTDAAALGLPSSWKLRDVRGAALSAVPSDPPMGEITTWHLPPTVIVSFWVEGSPNLTIRHPEGPPLLVLGKRIHVVSGKIEEKSVLVKEGGVTLW